MPKKVNEPIDRVKVNEELLLNIILDKDDKVWWYEGMTASDLKQTVFANEMGIRDIIYWKQKKLAKTYGSKDTMICLIKTTDDANYENMVDALDEMDITGVKRYAMQDIQPPELETRIAILRKKAAQDKLNAPDDVLEYIASKISTNIRELEGALIRVTAFASLNRQGVDLGLAEIVLKDLIPNDASSEVTAATIMAQTAAYFSLTIDDLCGTSRSRVLVNARQIAMYLAKILTLRSLPEIGRRFGGRDHTTVLHAVRKIELLAKTDGVLSEEIELLKRMLTEQ